MNKAILLFLIYFITFSTNAQTLKKNNDNSKDALIHWDGAFSNAFGLGGGGTISCLSEFSVADIEAFGVYGGELTQIHVYINEVPTSLYVVIYDDDGSGKPGTLLYEEDVTDLINIDTDNWNTFTLSTPFNIDKKFYLGCRTTHANGVSPLGEDGGDVADPRGDWCNWGTGWEHLGAYSIGSINIRGFATSPIIPAPIITTQPQNSATCETETVNFNIIATNTNSYQWYDASGMLSDGGDISGVATNQLSIANVEQADEGTYYCIVTGDGGSLQSDNVNLTVNSQVTISSQPVSLNAYSGENVQFTVSVEGTTTSYQWQKDNIDLQEDADVLGVNTNTLTLNNVSFSDVGAYHLIINGPCNNITSDDANLNIISGVNDITAYNLKVYPNPSYGLFYVKGNNISTVKVFDILGNKISVSYNKSSSAIKFSNYSSGIYFINVMFNDNTSVNKKITIR